MGLSAELAIYRAFIDGDGRHSGANMLGIRADSRIRGVLTKASSIYTEAGDERGDGPFRENHGVERDSGRAHF